ncbi:MAG: lysophospholipid acyltransferase family protein [Pseudomonadales bacterium]|jgi:Kdo2-lipid IVA lauroyltransferase/acyltransferase|nr:lysophospholipid acyltransferase family protein [Pseudomonadales bacterium]
MLSVVKLTASLVQILLYLLSLLPRKFSQRLGTLAGMLNAKLNSRSARVTRANVDLCLTPQAGNSADNDKFSTQSLIETGKTLMETPAVWLGDIERIDGWIQVVHNEALLREHLNDSTGLLVLLPHMGNWELFNVFYRRYGQMTALYQPPRQDYMQKVMQKVRVRHGNHMVPTTRSGLKQLYKTLREGGTAVILPDQVPAKGQFVPFFEQPALTDVLASRLLKKTGAKVLGIAMVRSDEGLFDAHVLAPDSSIYEADEVTSIRAVNDLMQTCAEIAPKQYQWEYKRFRERPAGSKKIYRFNKPSGVH